MRFAVAVLLLSAPCWSATVLRIGCGGPTGSDAAGNVWQTDTLIAGGGGQWTTAGSPDRPYRNLRFSSPPGAPLVFTIPVSNGVYSVILKFVEPNATAAGQRIFSVTINGGAAAIVNLDLFAAAGALVPVDRSFPVTVATGSIRIVLTPSKGNAVLSGIQVDAPDPPPPPPPLTLGAGPGIQIQLQQSSNFAVIMLDQSLQTLGLNTIRPPYFSPPINGPEDSRVIPGSVHGFLPCPGLDVRLYELVPGTSTTWRKLEAGATWDGLTCDVTITFAAPQVNYRVVISGPGGGVPVVANLEGCTGSGPTWNCAGIMRGVLVHADGTQTPVHVIPSDGTPPGPQTAWSPVK